MLSVERLPNGWSVMRDGVVLDEGGQPVTYQMQDTAVRHVMRLARATGEHVQPMEWVRRHADGWTARIALTEWGKLRWHVFVWPGGGELTRAEAADIQEARHTADEAVRRAGHACSAECARW